MSRTQPSTSPAEHPPPTNARPLSVPDASSGASSSDGRRGRWSRKRGLVKKAFIVSVVLLLPAAALGLFSSSDEASAVLDVQSLWPAAVPDDTDAPDSTSVT